MIYFKIFLAFIVYTFVSVHFSQASETQAVGDRFEWEGSRCVIIDYSANEWAVCENDSGQAVIHDDYDEFVGNLRFSGK